MKRLTLFLGAALLMTVFTTSLSAAEPNGSSSVLLNQQPAQAAAQVAVNTSGTPATLAGYRHYYRHHYGPRSYYGRPYRGYYRGYGGYYGPGYYGRGYGYYGGYGGYGYYSPSYYNGPLGIVNAYPGGVNVGGLHVGW